MNTMLKPTNKSSLASTRPIRSLRPLPLRSIRVAADNQNGTGPSTAVQEKPSTPAAAPVAAAAAAPAPPKNPFDYGTITPEFDETKEDQREYMRTVYFADDWKRHRSSWRYLRHLSNMTNSRIVYYLFVPSTFFAALTGAIGTYATLLENGTLPAYLPTVPNTSQGLSLMVTALSLLLVFRTNSSYGRWDEARKMWGLVVNRSRDMARQSLSWFPRADEQQMFQRWLGTFPFIMKCHLLSENPTDADLALLLPAEREKLLASKHRPVFTLQIMSNLIQRAGLTDLQLSKMDANLTSMEDCLGGCERILRSPIPLGYTRHTSRMLILWLLQLPFGLWYSLQWEAVPAVFILSYFTLGIEEIGVLIEEPFSILPLNAICNTIKTNVEEVGATRKVFESISGPQRLPAQSINRNDPATWL